MGERGAGNDPDACRARAHAVTVADWGFAAGPFNEGAMVAVAMHQTCTGSVAAASVRRRFVAGRGLWGGGFNGYRVVRARHRLRRRGLQGQDKGDTECQAGR